MNRTEKAIILLIQKHRYVYVHISCICLFICVLFHYSPELNVLHYVLFLSSDAYSCLFAESTAVSRGYPYSPEAAKL